MLFLEPDNFNAERDAPKDFDREPWHGHTGRDLGGNPQDDPPVRHDQLTRENVGALPGPGKYDPFHFPKPTADAARTRNQRRAQNAAASGWEDLDDFSTSGVTAVGQSQREDEETQACPASQRHRTPRPDTGQQDRDGSRQLGENYPAEHQHTRQNRPSDNEAVRVEAPRLEQLVRDRRRRGRVRQELPDSDDSSSSSSSDDTTPDRVEEPPYGPGIHRNRQGNRRHEDEDVREDQAPRGITNGTITQLERQNRKTLRAMKRSFQINYWLLRQALRFEDGAVEQMQHTQPPAAQTNDAVQGQGPQDLLTPERLTEQLKEQLFASARTGGEPIDEWLLENGADIHALNDRGQTALHVAAESLKCNVAGSLLRCGADTEWEDGEGKRVLDSVDFRGPSIAVQNMVNRLVEAGAQTDVQRDWQDTPLHRAVMAGSVEAVELLLSYGAHVDARILSDPPGHTPLLRLCWAHHSLSGPVLMKQLIDGGADVNAESVGVGKAVDVLLHSLLDREQEVANLDAMGDEPSVATLYTPCAEYRGKIECLVILFSSSRVQPISTESSERTQRSYFFRHMPDFANLSLDAARERLQRERTSVILATNEGIYRAVKGFYRTNENRDSGGENPGERSGHRVEEDILDDGESGRRQRRARSVWRGVFRR